MQGVFFRHRIIVSPNVHLSDRNRRREVKIMVKEPEFGLKDEKSWSEPDFSALWCGKVWFKVVGSQL